jgi:hypothetical protein
MASVISALTSGGGGISMTGDASGILNLNSNGTNVVAVSSTGMAVTGTLSSSGASTFTGTGKFATTIGVGNATPAASGAGITFPATQSASSDANTLDDYEEGTWTPVPVSLTVVGTPTYTGTYTKIGNYVFIIATIQSTTSTAATADTTRFTGLPFTASAINGIGLSLNTSTTASTAAGQVSSATYVTGGWAAAANIRLAAWYQI